MIENPYANPVSMARAKISYERINKKENKIDFKRLLTQSLYWWTKWWYFRTLKPEDVVNKRGDYLAENKKIEESKTALPLKLVSAQKFEKTVKAMKLFLEANQGNEYVKNFNINKLESPYKDL